MLPKPYASERICSCTQGGGGRRVLVRINFENTYFKREKNEENGTKNNNNKFKQVAKETVEMQMTAEYMKRNNFISSTMISNFRSRVKIGSSF